MPDKDKISVSCGINTFLNGCVVFWNKDCSRRRRWWRSAATNIINSH